MLSVIHQSKLWELMQRRDATGKPEEFDLQYCKKGTGELVSYRRCVLTSIHAKGSTINVLVDGDTKTLRRCLITKYNDKKVIF